MKLKEKIQIVERLIKEGNSNAKIAYANFFKFLEPYNAQTKHRKLNKAIEDLERRNYEYEN